MVWSAREPASPDQVSLSQLRGQRAVAEIGHELNRCRFGSLVSHRRMVVFFVPFFLSANERFPFL